MSLPALGIDSARLKFDVCLMNVGGRRRHKVFPNTAAGFAQFAAWLTGQHYERRIQDSWEAWKADNKLLSPRVTPVALDVQVTPEAIKLGKDLDNIFGTVSRSLGRQVFGPGGHVSAFGIYVTDKLEGETSGNVRVEFLPRYAVFDFERTVEEVLEKAAECIEGRL
jgi:hypothetical protein